MSSSIRAKRDEREVDGVEHQLDAHEHDQRVAPHEQRRPRRCANSTAASTRYHGRGRAARARARRSAARRRRRCRRRSRSLSAAPPGRPGQHHRADDGDHEQHRGDLEGEHVVGEQTRGRAALMLGRRRASSDRGRRSRAGLTRSIVVARRDRRRSPCRGRRRRRRRRAVRWPFNGSIAEVFGAIDAEQHDHEQEQHDDRTGVDDHLHCREELASWATNSTATPNSVSTRLSAAWTGLRAQHDAEGAARARSAPRRSTKTTQLAIDVPARRSSLVA